MNTTSFTEILKNPQSIDTDKTNALTAIIKEYPYFQAARALHLKGLKNNNSFKYNAELKTTAAYTTDRTILFDFITSHLFSEKQEENIVKDVHQQIKEKIVEEKPKEVTKELNLGSPISFSKTETHSFNEWLQLSTQKKIVRNNNKEESKKAIIDNFIKLNPKISKVSKSDSTKEIVLKDKQDSSLMTETLAKVYLEQNKYENAIKAYEILSLKYPEKSGFFADQIKKIRILQKNKS